MERDRSPECRPVGRPEPRIGTQPLRPLTPETSLGFECIEFAETVLDIKLLPWQRWWLIHAFETIGPADDGMFRYKTIITLVGRQCGKTTLLKIVSLWLMFMGRVRLVLGAAQSLDIARESWAGAVDIANSDKDMREQVEFIRRANGEQEMRLSNGARYRITAATRSAGRGLSVDLLILDELREHRDWSAWSALSKTTVARPNGLRVAISNAGDDNSVVLNQLRETAIAESSETVGIFEWSAPDGAEIDDDEAVAQGTPGVGHTISWEAIDSQRATDPPAVFRTEVMCQRVESLDQPVSPAAWSNAADARLSMEAQRGRVHLCLDVAPDGAHCTIAASALGEDGRARVVIAWSGTAVADMRKALPDLISEIKPRSIGYFPGGPAAAFMADFENLKHVRKTAIRSGDVAAVCQGFAEQVVAGALRHNGDPLLTAHVLGSSRLPSGDGWRFARKGGNADAAYAAAGAVHMARTVKSAGKPRIVSAKKSA